VEFDFLRRDSVFISPRTGFGAAVNAAFELTHSASALQITFTSSQTHDIGNES